MRRIFVVWLCAMMMAGSAFIGISFENGVGGGDTNPEPRASYIITNVWELQNMSLDLAGDYALANDIDASITASWNGGAGFEPVGSGATPFTGALHGEGYSITGLYINRPSQNYVGLIGYMPYGAGGVGNIYLKDVTVIGYDYVGSLIGFHGNSISNCHVSRAYVSGNYSIGGLIGRNEKQFIGSFGVGTCSSNADVNGIECVGGLVGVSTDFGLSSCFCTGNVVGGNTIGGLIGSTSGLMGGVGTCYSTANVSGINIVGGLVGNFGYVTRTIGYSYATGHVSGSTNVGGLVGSSASIGTHSTCHWDIETTGQTTSPGGGSGNTTAELKQQATYVNWNFNDTWFMVDGETRPFLRWEHSTSIRNGHQLQLMAMNLTADYTLIDDIDLTEIQYPAQMWGTSPTSGNGFVPIGNDTNRFTGTFDGYDHTIYTLYITRPSILHVALFGYTYTGAVIQNVGLEDVDVTGDYRTGGLVGSNDGGAVFNSYSTGTITGGSDSGGLVGASGGTINNTYFIGSVTGISYVGGLVGSHAGFINNSYSTGTVNGGLRVGGFVGARNVGIITNSFTTSNVFGNNQVGGFIGKNDGIIANCYATGDVSGSSLVGGFAGDCTGTVEYCYSVGAVPTSGTNIGGFIGSNNSGTYTDDFWDIDTSGTTTGIGSGADPEVQGRTTPIMKRQATFTTGGSNWDFINIWGIVEDITYPYLIPLGNPWIVAHWPFNEGWGQYTNDTSTHHNDGTLMPSYPGNVPAWTSQGISGNALYFDHTDDYVDIQNTQALNDTYQSEGTLSMWVKPKSDWNDADNHFLFRPGLTTTDFMLYKDWNQDLLSLYIGGVMIWSLPSDFGGWNINKWYHITAVWENVGSGSANGNLYLYVDGNLVRTITGATIGNPDLNPATYIGSQTAGMGTDGVIDEVSLWGWALNASEVYSLYYVHMHLANTPWPIFGQNLEHTGRSPCDTSHIDGSEKWTFSTGSWVRSSPVIGNDGTIYVGSLDNNLYAINPNGTEKWHFTTGDSVESSPSISNDGTIYMGSYDDNLYAINPNGSEKWHFTTGNDIISSPAIGDDGMIYVGSLDSNLYAIYPNGTEKWHFPCGNLIFSSPAIADDGTIYVGSYNNRLYAINQNGTERWHFTTGNGIYSSPTIGADATIYIGSRDNKLYAVYPNGTEKWSFTTGGMIYSSPAVCTDGTIYIGSFDSNIYAVSPNGTEKWNFTTGDRVFSVPSIGNEGTIYVSSNDNNLYAIDPNGAEKWHFGTSGSLYSSPAIDADGTIYFGSDDSKLYAIGSSLRARWPFDEGWGQYTNDTSMYDNDGTLMPSYPGNVPAWTNGISAYALDFDGADDCVNVPAVMSINYDTNFTISTWIKAEECTGNHWIIRLGDLGTTGAFLTGLRVWNGEAMFSCAEEMVIWEDTPGYSISESAWYNVVGANQDREMRLYVNGVFRANATFTRDTTTSSTRESTIGRYYHTYGDPFNGTIDEVSVWDRALNATEISESYNTTWHEYLVNESLEAHWPFSEGRGQLTNDTSGNDNDGTLMPDYPGNIPSWANGISGYALDFDGTDDYVSVPNSSTINLNSNTMTLEAWIHPRNNPDFTRVVSKGGAIYQYALAYGYAAGGTSGKLRFYINNGSTVKQAVTTTDITEQRWYHIVGTYDGSFIRIYVDGIEENNADMTGNIAGSAANLGIGSEGDGGLPFNGTIDEVSIWSRALNASEISEHYNTTWHEHIINESLEAHWPFSEGWGQITNDTSGNDNDGILMPAYPSNVPVWTNGISGYALDFDGLDDYVSVQDDYTLDITDQLTVEAWIRPSDGGWKYMKPVNISNLGSLLTDYQINLTIDFLPGKMNPDFSDLRFCDSSGKKLVSWVESQITGSIANVWVEVPSIPTGNSTIYMFYGNPVATHETTWSGNITLPSTSIPTGWSYNSALDGRFPRGNSVYGGTGGSETHTHNYGGTTSNPTNVYNGASVGLSIRAYASAGHTHDFSGTTDEASSLPPYLDVIFVYNNTIPFNIDTSCIALFDTTSLPSSWLSFSVLNDFNYFPRSNSIYGGTGGSATHSHTFSGTTADLGIGDVYIAMSQDADYVVNGHTHTFSGTTDAASSLPPYFDVIYGQPTSNTQIPSGMIAMFDSLPPLGWSYFSPLDGRFPRGSTTYGGTGWGTHTHSYSGSVDTVVSYSVGITPGTDFSVTDSSHSHLFSFTTAPVTVLPPYLDVIFARRNTMSVNVSFGSENAAVTTSIKKVDSYGLGASQTTAIATINDQTISTGISPEWNYIVQTYNGSSQCLYVNGELQASRPLSGPIDTNDNDLLMGELFSGVIDEVSIWGRALNASEIFDQYKMNMRVHNIDTDEYFYHIQEAIDDPDTLDGHTIEASAGMFYENIIVNKSLTIIGENRGTTFIDGGGSGDVVSISSDWVNISGFTISNSGINNDDAGIELDSAENCTIADNVMSSHFTHGIYLNWDSNYNTISDNVLSDSYYGIRLYHSSNNTISNNTATSSNNNYGIHVWWFSNDNNIIGNTIRETVVMAIYLENANFNTVSNNNVSSNQWNGIFLSTSHSNTISENVVSSNIGNYGIYLTGSDSNVLTENWISSNSNWGVHIGGGTANNQIYYNNFIGNAFQAQDDGVNLWHNGFPSGGNYWSDYSGSDLYHGPNQDLPGSDGIGDTNYTNIQGGSNVDEYPLMSPFEYVEYDVPLQQGWNLISLPMRQLDWSIDSVLENIAGKWDCIQTYDALTGTWLSNNTYRPGVLNDLGGMNHLKAYWINITEPGVTLSVTGDLFGSALSIPLYAGWNLVGYPSLVEKTIAESLIGTGYDAPVEGFNATAPYHISQLADIYMMKPGESYWVHVPADSIWIVDF
jgi:parallel beta-helix repeat protein